MVPVAARAQLKCLSPEDKEIRSVSFQGNQRFSSDELKLRVLAEPTDLVRRFFRKVVGTRRCVRGALLASDSLRLWSFYRDQGFPDIRVRSPEERQNGDHWVDIVYTVSEGEPVLIDSVTVRPDSFAGLNLGQDLTSVLRMRPGGRYSPAIAQTDVDSIETRLKNNGYPHGSACVFERRLSGPAECQPDTPPPTASGHRISVGILVTPGPLTHFGRVTITDTSITGDPPLISQQAVRQLLPFKEGDLYQLRLLTQAQRQLYQLGTFDHTEVQQDTSNAAPTDTIANIKVLVVESYMHEGHFIGGWGTQDCFQTGFQYSDKALFHSINRLELSGRMSKLGWAPRPGWPVARDLCRSSLIEDVIGSSKLNYSTTMRFTQPAAFGGLLDRSVGAYSEVRGNYKAFLRTTLIGGNASLSKLLAEKLVANEPNRHQLIGLLGYNLEYGHTDAPPSVLCANFRACQPIEQQQLSRDQSLAVLNSVFTRDWRDNAVIPTGGTLARVEGRLSSKYLGSNAALSFRKGVGDLTWYHTAFRSNVAVIRFRGGIIGGGEQTAAERYVPPQERLYTGGETSVRGYGPNELGPLIYVTSQLDTAATGDTLSFADCSLHPQGACPRVERIPSGGNAMLVWNLEYRLRGPIFTNRLQTILFYDVGRIWTPSSSGQDQRFKGTPGVAFRVFTPIGPVQFNIGYKGDRDPLGPVFYNAGISGSGAGALICVSNTGSAAPGDCQSTFAPPFPEFHWLKPQTWLNRLKFSIAFPPDY